MFHFISLKAAVLLSFFVFCGVVQAGRNENELQSADEPTKNTELLLKIREFAGIDFKQDLIKHFQRRLKKTLENIDNKGINHNQNQQEHQVKEEHSVGLLLPYILKLKNNVNKEIYEHPKLHNLEELAKANLLLSKIGEIVAKGLAMRQWFLNLEFQHFDWLFKTFESLKGNKLSEMASFCKNEGKLKKVKEVAVQVSAKFGERTTLMKQLDFLDLAFEEVKESDDLCQLRLNLFNPDTAVGQLYGFKMTDEELSRWKHTTTGKHMLEHIQLVYLLRPLFDALQTKRMEQLAREFESIMLYRRILIAARQLLEYLKKISKNEANPLNFIGAWVIYSKRIIDFLGRLPALNKKLKNAVGLGKGEELFQQMEQENRTRTAESELESAKQVADIALLKVLLAYKIMDKMVDFETFYRKCDPQRAIKLPAQNHLVSQYDWRETISDINMNFKIAKGEGGIPETIHGLMKMILTMPK